MLEKIDGIIWDDGAVSMAAGRFAAVGIHQRMVEEAQVSPPPNAARTMSCPS